MLRGILWTTIGGAVGYGLVRWALRRTFEVVDESCGGAG